MPLPPVASGADFIANPGSIGAKGGLIAVAIDIQPAEHEARRWTGKMAIPPVRTHALIDTGADRSFIRPRLVEELLLEPVRHVPVQGVMGKTKSLGIYPITMTIGTVEESADPINLIVVAGQLVDGVAECILGRDVLRHGGLAWYGDAHEFALVLPKLQKLSMTR